MDDNKMIREELNKVLDGENLSANESRHVIDLIMSGKVSHVQIAAFLTVLRQKGETSDEIIGAAQAMRDKVVRINHNQKNLFDNCGTVGDGAGTFNISTVAAFVTAGAGTRQSFCLKPMRKCRCPASTRRRNIPVTGTGRSMYGRNWYRFFVCTQSSSGDERGCPGKKRAWLSDNI